MQTTETLAFPRPRRTRHDSSKHYESERKDLELTQVIEVLGAYANYGGGINCSVCGKLYKSRVCFIKHLWEHTIYWDRFAGDKNHMRVLSIQAALILYASCSHDELPIAVDSLLVTSPNNTEHQGKEPRSPGKDEMSRIKSGWDCSGACTEVSPAAPKKVTYTQSSCDSHCGVVNTGTDVLSPHNTGFFKLPSTPMKRKKMASFAPPKPVKKNMRRPNCDSVHTATDVQAANVGDFFVASPGVQSEDLYWKEADAYPCKRKRSE